MTDEEKRMSTIADAFLANGHYPFEIIVNGVKRYAYLVEKGGRWYCAKEKPEGWDESNKSISIINSR